MYQRGTILTNICWMHFNRSPPIKLPPTHVEVHQPDKEDGNTFGIITARYDTEYKKPTQNNNCLDYMQAVKKCQKFQK